MYYEGDKEGGIVSEPRRPEEATVFEEGYPKELQEGNVVERDLNSVFSKREYDLNLKLVGKYLK